MKKQRTAHRARARWRTWRGCLRFQRGARSTPHRWPRLFFTSTAPGQRLRLQSNVTKTLIFRYVRRARASPRGEPAISPRSTRALADLAMLPSRPTQGALHPTPLAEASLHRHRAWSAAAASGVRGYRFRIPRRAARAVRPPRASPVEIRPTAHRAHARWRTWRGCLTANVWAGAGGALRPTPLAGAPLQRHRARSAAVASKRRKKSD